MRRISANVPAVIVGVARTFIGSGDVVEVIEKEHRRTRLPHGNTCELPAFEHLAPGLARRHIVGRRECEAMAKVEIAASFLSSVIKAVLWSKAEIIGVPSRINGMTIRVSGQKIQT